LARPVDDYATVPSLDALQWDWFGLMRAGTPMEVSDHAHRAGFEKAFAKMQKKGATADGLSLEHLFLAHLAPGPEPLTALDKLAAQNPNDAMVHHRLSVAALMVRNYTLALSAALTAARLAPEAPAHIAWRGMLRIRAKQFAAAVDDLQDAITHGLALPRLYLLLAQSQARLNDRTGTLTTLALGIGLSPLDQEFRFMRARILAESGDHAAALADLDVLDRHDGRSPKVLQLHAACLRATGQLDQAHDLLQRGLEHAPGQANLLDELARLLAARSGLDAAE